MTNKIKLITGSLQLDQLINSLLKEPWIAIDTEFLREKTYYPELCLIQIATVEQCWCIDTLAITHLQPLAQLLSDKNIVKIFHSPDQDLEIFFDQLNIPVNNIFDTQVASQFLGYREQVSYAELVEKFLQITLDKTHQRDNWKQRPLPDSFLSYAANDVIYLAQIYPKLENTLKEKGRFDWAMYESKQFAEPRRYKIKLCDAWKRLKNLSRFDDIDISVAQHLAAWREELAQDRNRPRQWIIKNDSIILLARLLPTTHQELALINDLSPRTLEKNGENILKIIKQFKGSEPPYPVHDHHNRTTQDERIILKKMMALIRLTEKKIGINATCLATRKDLVALIKNKPSRVLSGWRKDIIADDLNLIINSKN